VFLRIAGRLLDLHCRGRPERYESVGPIRHHGGLIITIWPLQESLAFRLHDLRHEWATFALGGTGVLARIVSERLGHAGIGSTVDLYSYVTPPLEREAAEMAAGVVFGARESVERRQPAGGA
jgi:integrase